MEYKFEPRASAHKLRTRISRINYSESEASEHRGMIQNRFSFISPAFGDFNDHAAETYNRGLGDKLITGRLLPCCPCKSKPKHSRPEIRKVVANGSPGVANHRNLGDPMDQVHHNEDIRSPNKDAPNHLSRKAAPALFPSGTHRINLADRMDPENRYEMLKPPKKDKDTLHNEREFRNLIDNDRRPGPNYCINDVDLDSLAGLPQNNGAPVRPNPPPKQPQNTKPVKSTNEHTVVVNTITKHKGYQRLSSRSNSSGDKYITKDIFESRSPPTPAGVFIKSEEKHVNVYNTFPMEEKTIVVKEKPIPQEKPIEEIKPNIVAKPPAPITETKTRVIQREWKPCQALYRPCCKESNCRRTAHRGQLSRPCGGHRRTSSTSDGPKFVRMTQMLNECLQKLERYKDKENQCDKLLNDVHRSESSKNYNLKCQTDNDCDKTASKGDSYAMIDHLFKSLSVWIKEHKADKQGEIKTEDCRCSTEISSSERCKPYFNIEMYQMKCGKERIVINKM